MLVLVFRTLILYTIVVTAMRIMGKRQIGEMQPSELAVAIMISDLASVPMQAIDIPLLAGAIPVLTLLVAEVLLSFLSLKSRVARRIFTGQPSIIIYQGHLNEKEMRRIRFNMNDLQEQLRSGGYPNISDVEVAVLETNGTLSIIPKKQARTVTVRDLGVKGAQPESLPYMLISDGRLNQSELTRSGKSKDWLLKELKKLHVFAIRDVFYGCYDENGGLQIQRKGEEDKK